MCKPADFTGTSSAQKLRKNPSLRSPIVFSHKGFISKCQNPQTTQCLPPNSNPPTPIFPLTVIAYMVIRARQCHNVKQEQNTLCLHYPGVPRTPYALWRELRLFKRGRKLKPHRLEFPSLGRQVSLERTLGNTGALVMKVGET